MIQRLQIRTQRRGLVEITDEVDAVVRRAAPQLPRGEGLCTVFVRHTSASLVIQENADPSARRDLESWMARLVVDGDSIFTHTAEGTDDMPSHVRSALTQTSVGIPVVDGRLDLGTWQGIYLWEHRRAPHDRTVTVHVAG